MFLDVFDLVLPNILSNIGQIFKGKCVFSCAKLTGLIIIFSWLCKVLNVLIITLPQTHTYLR